MDTRYLRTFHDLAQTLNITRTGMRLDYAPSSIAAHVHALELEVGVPLIERAGRAITLTEAGRVLAHQARRVLDAERDVFASARTAGGEPSIAIGSAASIASAILPSVIGEVRERIPGMAMALRQMDCVDILAGIASGDLDLGFTLEFASTLDRLRTPAMSSVVLADVAIATIVSRRHPLATVLTPVAADLADTTLVMTEPGCSYREAFHRYLEANRIVPRAPIELDNFEAIKRCVEAALGIAYVPRFVVEHELATGAFVELPLGPNERYALTLTWRRGIDDPVLNAIREAALHRLAREGAAA